MSLTENTTNVLYVLQNAMVFAQQTISNWSIFILRVDQAIIVTSRIVDQLSNSEKEHFEKLKEFRKEILRAFNKSDEFVQKVKLMAETSQEDVLDCLGDEINEEEKLEIITEVIEGLKKEFVVQLQTLESLIQQFDEISINCLEIEISLDKLAKWIDEKKVDLNGKGEFEITKTKIFFGVCAVVIAGVIFVLIRGSAIAVATNYLDAGAAPAGAAATGAAATGAAAAGAAAAGAGAAGATAAGNLIASVIGIIPGGSFYYIVGHRTVISSIKLQLENSKEILEILMQHVDKMKERCKGVEQNIKTTIKELKNINYEMGFCEKTIQKFKQGRFEERKIKKLKTHLNKLVVACEKYEEFRSRPINIDDIKPESNEQLSNMFNRMLISGETEEH